MKKILLICFMFVVFITLAGCFNNDAIKPFGQKENMVLIANSLGETLSTFNSKDDLIENNISTLGQAPNQIVVRGSLAYVVNSLSNSIQIVDLSNFATVREISLGAGKNPMNIAILNKNKAYVTNFVTNTVDVINPSETDVSKQILKTIQLPLGADLSPNAGVTANAARPQGAIIKDNKLYVNLANLDTLTYGSGGPGFVCVIDTQTDAIVKEIQTSGTNANGMYSDEDNPHKIYVSCSGGWGMQDGTVEILDTVTDTISKSFRVAGGPGSMAVANGKIYAGDIYTGEIMVFDKDSNSSSPSINRIVIAETDYVNYIYTMISGIAVDTNGNLYAVEFNSDTLYVIDTATDSVKKGPIITGDGPQALAVIK